LKTPDTKSFSSLVKAYKGSEDYRKLADSTKEHWLPSLDKVGQYFGPLQIKQFDRPEKIWPIIRKWRNRWADRPRSADYGLQVLSRVLAFAVEDSKIAGNPCEGISRLYKGDRSEIIWTDADIAQIKKTCSPEIANAIDLAATTGLRLCDLLRLTWPNVGEDAITISAGKSGHKRTALIPLYDDLRAVLDRIPKRSISILTGVRRRPWNTNSFGTAFYRAG
jgi:integrase